MDAKRTIGFAKDRQRPITRSDVGDAILMPIRRGFDLVRLAARWPSALFSSL